MGKKDKTAYAVLIGIVLGATLGMWFKPQATPKEPLIIFNQVEELRSCNESSEDPEYPTLSRVTFVQTSRAMYKLKGGVCSNWANRGVLSTHVQPIITGGKGSLCAFGLCAPVILWEAN